MGECLKGERASKRECEKGGRRGGGERGKLREMGKRRREEERERQVRK